ncbi:mitochondrial fission ELM1-domain-containing protein [Lobosporangium transversale]|uniref:Mitochondrial fission ELM1-domain-containing protein n=1 Tax=Lobosporangium transversale TaxID=64571 RepID=A0A1Y2GIR6_9FUNG|nr:mitochondrial fission ELM1-domain-containing protein [Lobosporangium transversale]ORZ10954.1 mitochondrial fission ELM1-domain-containing protein [Lobosporangium transversale]|eukprot:XP_021879471.1 mitochondrial fission ELM1-domain-containing protein [Lobosporangium transversale]
MHEKAYRRTRFAPRAVYQPTTPVTWIISEGSVSADKESIALAEALGLPWAIKRLQWIPTPFKKLLMGLSSCSDKLPWFMEGDALAAPYPSFVIGSGAKAFPAGLGLMKDQKNYFRINSTLNTITQRSLDVAKRKAFELELIPKSFFNQGNRNGLTRQPIVTILIGGPNEDCSHNTERLISRLSRLLDVQGSRVLLSFSQRTADNTKVAVKKLESHIQDENRLYVYDPVADAMLALADKIVVTADSVAMTNEALATGKPVYILGGELARGKLKITMRPARSGLRRVPVLSGNEPNIVSNITTNDTADPLSYPGDHPPWNHKLLADQGTEEVKRLAQRLKIIRDCRISGRRIPEEIANSTC